MTCQKDLINRIFDASDPPFETEQVKGGVAITAVYPEALSSDGSIIIPATIDSADVVGIDEFVFEPFMACECASDIKRIFIPASVRLIVKNAFEFSDAPIEVDPNNRNYSSDSAGALFDKAQTRLIRYSTASELQSYAIPDTVTTIDKSAFGISSQLKRLHIPASVVTIGDGAFVTTECALEVEPNNPLFSSSDGVLFNKSRTKLLRYPSCNPAREYHIPETVEEIAPDAFNYCSKLKSITLPAAVKTVAKDAFSCCRLAFDVSPQNPKFSSVAGLLFDKTQTTLLLALPDGGCEIPDSTKRIDDEAFDANDALTHVEIPASVESIGRAAFSNCINLKAATFSDALQSLDDYAFFGCMLLAEVVLNEGVKRIGEKSFARCYRLERVVLPKSLVQIGNTAFVGSPVSLIVYKDSFAEKWAKVNKIQYEVIE